MSSFVFSNHFQAPTSCSINSESSVGPFSIFRQSPDKKQDFMRFAQWTNIEKAKYAAFIDFYRSSMERNELKSLWKKFDQMGNYLQTRNQRQCKSYHQKMVEKHKSFDNILQFLFEASPEVEQMARKQKQQLMVLSAKHVKKGLLKQLPLLSSTGTQEQTLPQIIKVEKSKEEEWKQCHQLFLQWTKRLQNLILPQARMIA